ncbi:MAG TPA: hypothetical protein VJP02_07785 [Candidatus Sulfotelmatobacter sp.]|nr:hypothetical protein [Candidatus Sulfotelmatobacter sp.]
MKVASFDAALKSLNKLDPWLRSLGIEPKGDRWHQAVEMVQRAKEQRAIVERGGPRAHISNYMDGLFEAMEIHEIVKAFYGDSSPALTAKLTRALCGPISPFDEPPKNGEARNTMFELSLAADWKNAGSAIEVGEPDIKLRAPAALFQTECKRPFSEKSVRKNIEDAASQLGKELNKPGNENDYGIVAISLSRVFTKGNLGCFASAGMGKQVIGEALAEMLDDHTQQWGLKRFREMHPRIVAVMFHLAAPWDIVGERLIHLSTSNFLETGNDTRGWNTLRNHVESLEQAVA